MAREVESKSSRSTGSGPQAADSLKDVKLNLVESVRAIAAKNARAPLDNEENLLLFLRSWWSKTYNKPLKDPLLNEYGLEDLLYEFYDKLERSEAEEEMHNSDNDRIEEDKEKANLDWAEEQEKRELEELKKKVTSKQSEVPAPPVNPVQDPENKKWMEEQIAKAKAELGEDFGEDITTNFEE
jgi:hypothetical protein